VADGQRSPARKRGNRTKELDYRENARNARWDDNLYEYETWELEQIEEMYADMLKEEETSNEQKA
jgi:hypothetical protein